MDNLPDNLVMFSAAQRYCGNYDEMWNAAGGAQYEICRAAGLKPSHKLLEIGCGCLSAGFILMQYVDFGHYCGIDPNKWLIDAALGNSFIAQIAARSAPRFVYNNQFDATPFGEAFDFIFAHSVLSHASVETMNQFLDGCTKVSASPTKIVASFRNGPTNHATGWIYPDHSYLFFDEIAEEAAVRGWHAELRHEYKEMLIAQCPTNVHDWIELTRV